MLDLPETSSASSGLIKQAGNEKKRPEAIDGAAWTPYTSCSGGQSRRCDDSRRVSLVCSSSRIWESWKCALTLQHEMVQHHVLERVREVGRCECATSQELALKRA